MPLGVKGFQKGNLPHNLGKPHLVGEKNPNWKDGKWRERKNIYQKEWCKTNRDYIQNYRLKKYGITLEQKQNMIALQDNRCAICRERFNENGKYIHVDHNHITKKVRSILCHNCNTALGLLKENKWICMEVVKYLERHDGN